MIVKRRVTKVITEIWEEVLKVDEDSIEIVNEKVKSGEFVYNNGIDTCSGRKINTSVSSIIEDFTEATEIELYGNDEMKARARQKNIFNIINSDDFLGLTIEESLSKVLKERNIKAHVCTHNGDLYDEMDMIYFEATSCSDAGWYYKGSTSTCDMCGELRSLSEIDSNEGNCTECRDTW